MKINKLLILLTLPLLFIASECEEITKLPVNIPISHTFTLTGNNNSLSSTTSFCLDDYAVYRDYENNINSIELLKITFRTNSVSPENLIGTVNVAILDSNTDNLIISANLGSIRLKDYLSPGLPYTLSLSTAQLNAINSLLAISGSNCFKTEVTISNISGGNPPYTINGTLDFLFEAETEF